MHDPSVVAFDIKNPFSKGKYKSSIVTVWHVDPEKDGTDDSCGWFMRSRHGDQATLARIAKDFEFQMEHGVPHPWFDKEGDPMYSPAAITLGMFRIAANVHFGHWSRQADRFLRRNTFNILHFAENSCDSLFTFITQHYGRDSRQTVAGRAREAAQIIYPWILRADRPWWKHPRWHVWHWKLQVHALQRLRRCLFSRCEVCGCRFKDGESVIGRCWDSPPNRWFEWFRSERYIRHDRCDEDKVLMAGQSESVGGHG